MINLVKVSLLMLLTALCGCTNWIQNSDGTVNWEGVNATTKTMELGVELATTLVCEKNPDLKPVFQAVGEGLTVFANPEEDLSPDQIKTYINMFMEDKGFKNSSTVVLKVLDTAIKQYSAFYSVYYGKLPEVAKICNSLVLAMGNGLRSGAVNDPSKSALPSNSSDEFNSMNAISVLEQWDMSCMVNE